MRSPALAVAWEFRQRHRWGLIVLAGYVLLLAGIRFVLLHPGKGVHFRDEESFALLVVVPLCATFMYLLAVFSFGLRGDVAGRQSMYPSRMFTLPVKTSALAGLPMLYGGIAMFLLWMITRALALWPADFDIPRFWPGVLAAALLAWTQAMTWMPYPLPGMRVIVTVLWLASIDAVVMLALQYKPSEATMITLLAPHIPLAYLAARYAIARARRGDVPDAQSVFTRIAALAGSLSRPQRNFSSAAAAQAWFEWRSHGRSLPALVGILLPFELALLFLFRDTSAIVFEIFFAALLTPRFMAAFVAATVSKSHPEKNNSYEIGSFLAKRPFSSAGLIRAKLMGALRSTAAAWLVVFMLVPLGLKLSGTWPVIADAAHQTVTIFGMPRAVAIGCLALFFLLLTTWKQLINSLFIGMSGREWLVKGSVFLALSLLALLVPAIYLIQRNRAAIDALWRALPLIVVVLVCCKISVAAWIGLRLLKNKLLTSRSVLIGASSWTAIVFIFYCLLLWIIPEMIIRSFFLAAAVILCIPLARIAAAPLALAWDRHRGRQLRPDPISKKHFIAAVGIISIPAVFAFIIAASFSIQNRNNGSMISSNERREYLLHLPKGYDRTRPTPLVISMHGAGGWPAQQMEMSQWNELADREKFIVVYPSGAEHAGPRTWSVDRGRGLIKDVRFISDLIDKLEASYNIDRARIYANGLSNGGGMSFVLSCTLSDRIAAVGMVAAAQSLSWKWCTDPRPVPMISFHGTADPAMPYYGGTTWIGPGYFPAIPAWTANWARRNGCRSKPTERLVATDVTRREYNDCVDDATVDLFTIHGGGHTWPGGKPLPEWFLGRTSNAINATKLMWRFFQDHPLRKSM